MAMLRLALLIVLTLGLGSAFEQSYSRYRSAEIYSAHHPHVAATVDDVTRTRSGKAGYVKQIGVHFVLPGSGRSCRATILLDDDPAIAAGDSFDLTPREGTCDDPVFRRSSDNVWWIGSLFILMALMLFAMLTGLAVQAWKAPRLGEPS